MLHLRKIKYHVLIALLSAVLIFPAVGNKKKSQEVLAWWGTIYPKFCFMEQEKITKDARPRYRFWIVDTLFGTE